MIILLLLMALWAGPLLAAENKPPVPYVESIVLAPVQPHSGSPDVIWYDNFDTLDPDQWKYMEPRPASPDAKLSEKEALGGAGRSMECFYARGKQGIGNRKIVFGDSPIGRPLRKGEHFEDVYWITSASPASADVIAPVVSAVITNHHSFRMPLVRPFGSPGSSSPITPEALILKCWSLGADSWARSPPGETPVGVGCE
jgi:hypothetical protein